jgi:class 3 adenylate cyclase/tetratricopeptide (TPR) repeat protein
VPHFVCDRLAVDVIEAPESTTRWGVVLLADIVGFTSHVEEITDSGLAGLDDLAGALDAYFAAFAASVSAHGGDILNVAGDAFLCCWWAQDDTEQAHADATLRAVQAAVAILDAVSSPALHERRFATRIGVSAGEVVTAFVGGWEGDWKLVVTGPVVTDAADAEHHSSPGSVLLGEPAARLVAGRCELRDAGGGWAELVVVESPIEPDPAPPRQSLHADRIAALLPGPVRGAVLGSGVHWLAQLRRVSVVMAGLTDLDHVSRAPLDVGHEAVRAFQSAIDRYEGWAHVVLDNKGVTALGVFGLPPLAHEDDAFRAVLAGQRIAGDLTALGLNVGVGVATGRAFSGAFGSDLRREYTVHGNVMNLAARLMAKALGTVLIDEETAAAVLGRFELDVQPPVSVKGLAAPVQPAIPGAEIVAASPSSGTVVGRAAELGVLSDLLRVAGHARRGATLVVTGDAGIGKSTLLADGTRTARAIGAVVITAAASSVEVATSYFAWRSVFAQLGTIAELRAFISDQPDLERLLPLVGVVVPGAPPDNDFTLQLDGEVRAENTRRVLTALIGHAARRLPTALVLEDVHWLDSPSWALLLDVVQTIPELSTVIASRPLSAMPPTELATILERPTTTQMYLQSLGADDVESLVASRLGVDEVPPMLTDFINERAAGNPFFCVELVQTMRESGLIAVVGRRCDVGDLSTADLPSTVEGVVVSRLDRLTPEQGLALRVAAVIGSPFLSETVRAVYPSNDGRTDVDSCLAHLASIGLTRALDATVAPSFSFGHEITREVAYGLLTQAQRQPLHASVVDWYERTIEDLDPHVALLADHCWRSGDPHRAVAYLERAGHQALRNGAFDEAIVFFQRALETGTNADTYRRATWTKGIGTAQYFSGDLAGSRQSFEAAVAAIDRPIPTSNTRLGPVLAGSVVKQAAHRIRPARYDGRHANRAAELNDAVECYRTLGQIYYLDGEPPPIMIYLTLAGLNVGEEAGPSTGLARILINAAVAAALVNMEGLAKQYADRAIAMAEAEGLRDASSYVWSIYAILLCHWGRWEPARTANDKAYKLIYEVGDRNLEAEVWQTRSTIELCTGHFDDAETAWRNTAELGIRAGNQQMLTWSLLDEAETWIGRSRLDEAVTALERALAIPTAPKDGSTEIEKHMVTSLVRCRQGAHEEADAEADRTVAIVAARLPAAFPWPDFCATAVEVHLEIASSGSDYGRTHRDELLAKASKGANVVKKVSKTFRNVRPRAALVAGLVASQQGRTDDALAALSRSAELAIAMEMPYDEARAALESARLLPAGANRNGRLDAAAETFARLGAIHLLEQVTALR